MYGGDRRNSPVLGHGFLFFGFLDMRYFYEERSAIRPNPNLEDPWRKGWPDIPPSHLVARDIRSATSHTHNNCESLSLSSVCSTKCDDYSDVIIKFLKT